MHMGIAFLFVARVSVWDAISLLHARLGDLLVPGPLEDALSAAHLFQLKRLGKRLIILILTGVLGNHTQMCYRGKMQ